MGDVGERAFLASQAREVLITEVQLPVTASTGGGGVDGKHNVRIDLPFNHAVTELIIVGRASDKSPSEGIADTTNKPFDGIKLMLNHQNRFYDDSVDFEYLQQVARRCHSGQRKVDGLAVIPFSLNPEVGAEPSGSLNFS